MWGPGGATYMSETCFRHISETYKASDLKLGTNTGEAYFLSPVFLSTFSVCLSHVTMYVGHRAARL